MPDEPSSHNNTCETGPGRLPWHMPDILVSAPVGFFTTAPDGRLLSANRNLAKIYGYDTPVELIAAITDIPGQSHADPADREKIRRILAADGKVVNYEYLLRRRDGSVGNVSTTVEAVRDLNEEIIFYQGFTIDITAGRHATETALQHREQYLDVIIETMRDGFLLSNETGQVIDTNEAYCRMSGYTKQEVLDLNVADLNADETPAEITARMARIRKTGAERFETRHRKKDGSLFNVEISMNWLNMQNGLVVRFLRDVTERKREQEALRDSEARTRALLEAIPDAIFLFNREGFFIDYQSNGQMKLFTSLDRFMNRHVSEVLPPGLALSTTAALEKIFTTFQPQTFQYTLDINHEPRHFETRLVHCEEEKALALVRDITEQKQTEKALQELNASLEQRVLERTRLADARLRELQQMAVELVEAEENQRRRIAELLHDDLQQILASARMQLQSAMRNLPHAPGLNKIEQLLEMSIAKSRLLSHELSPAVVHHSGIYKALEWLAAQMKEQFGMEVEFHAEGMEQFENTPLKVFIFRAVQELLFNVVKHAGVNRAWVELAGAGKALRVVVRDKGRGFDPDTLQASTDGKTGLGLITLQERLQALGGSLLIKSTPGQGSCFIIAVPSGQRKTRKLPPTY